MKKTTIFVLLLALSLTLAKEEKKKEESKKAEPKNDDAKKGQKRGIFGENHNLEYTSFNSPESFKPSNYDHHSQFHHDVGQLQSPNFHNQPQANAYVSHNVETQNIPFDAHRQVGKDGTIDLGTTVHKHITVTKKVGIPVPKPYPVKVERRIPVPHPVPVPVPVDKPYPVHIPKPYPVPVEKRVPYPVEKKVPFPVKVPVRVPVKVPVPVPYPQPYPVPVHKKIPVPVPHPVIVKKPVPVYLKENGGGQQGWDLQNNQDQGWQSEGSFDHSSANIELEKWKNQGGAYEDNGSFEQTNNKWA